MHIFVTHFLLCVSGKTNWLSNCKTQKNSELTTVSDEALALLLLDNMWDKWIDHDPKEFFGPGERDETGKQKGATSICGKYTKNGSGSKKFKGWSKEGMDQFNLYCNKVHKDHMEDAKKSDSFEKKFQQHCIGNDFKSIDDNDNDDDVMLVYNDLELML